LKEVGIVNCSGMQSAAASYQSGVKDVVWFLL
jgi:hypothetical protein